MKINAKRFKIGGDKVVWIVYILLMLISLLEVYSSMGKAVYDKMGGDIAKMFLKHFGLLLAGLLITYIFHRIKYVHYSKYIKIAYGGSVVLLLFTLILGRLFGEGAARWISLPGIGQFQPSEIVKYVLVLYIANELSLLKDGIKERKNFYKLIAKMALVCLLIFPENFSTSALVFLGCYVMIIIAGAKFRDYIMIVPVGLFLCLSVLGLYKVNPDILERSGTWYSRVNLWLNSDREEITQPNTATMAIATGGLLGKGIGNTTQGRFLSESHNDFIFAIILEEGGIIFGIVVAGLFFVLFYRSLKISRNARGLFGRYASVGIGFMIVFQALVNMMVATGLLPVTGQTLPFISYGGTSLLVSSAALGIMLNISVESAKSQDGETERRPEEMKLEDNSVKSEDNNGELKQE